MTVQVNTCRFETPKVVLALEREGVNVLPHPGCRTASVPHGHR
ncbi:MAG: hypothetical protein ACLUNZ_12975 [Evtepia sp.]